MDASDSIRARRLLNGVFRHKRKILVLATLTLLVTIAGITLWPRTYQSEAKLFVRLGRESVALDPTATTGQTVNFQKYQEEEVNSVLEILNSREIVERVVDAIGPEEVLSPSAAPSSSGPPTESFATKLSEKISSTGASALESIGLLDSLSARERAIRKLDQRLNATAARNSGVVSLTCLASTPQAAQNLAALASELFLDHHVGLTQTAGSHEFFSEQTDLLHQQLTKATETLGNWKTEHGIVSIEGARQLLLDEVGEVKLKVLTTDQGLEYSKERIDKIASEMDAIPATVVAGTTNAANAANAGMRQQLFELQQQEQALLSKMTGKHPKVVQIRQQREVMEQILAKTAPERNEATEAPNPVRQELEGDLLRERANASALAQQREVLNTQLTSLNEDIKQLNVQEVEFAELQQQVDTLRAEYLAHVSSLEQARVGKELDAERISSINLAQPANLIEKPTSPRKRLALAGGAFLAMVVSFGTAFALEKLDPTLRSRDQVESQLSVPVVASLPFEGKVSSRNGRLQQTAANERRTLAGRLIASSSSSQAATVAVLNCGDRLPASVGARLAMDATDVGSAPVLLVDADTQQRRAGNRFNANGSAGLSDVLSGSADLTGSIRDSGHHNLALMTAGSTEAGSEQIDLRRLRSSLQPLTNQFGLMIAEMPADGSNGSETLAACSFFDAVLLVVEAEHTRAEDALRVKRQLDDSGANVLGCVLHGQRDYIPRWLNRFV